ncbi:hypothetical protein RUND412_004909 [Rhizina undulata]
MNLLTALSPYFLTILSILTTTIADDVTYADPTVVLDYGTFQGKYSSAYNISYFRRIPFAAPPMGENRFRAPQPVEAVEGVYDSDQSFDMCPQRTVNGSEDCLYLALYSRPWTAEEKRPVMVFFYGGGFIQGNVDLTLPPSTYPVMNVSTLNDYIAVYSNYRTNAFGFLPGTKIKESETSDLNPGLLDQQAALRWVNTNIANFGGDPTNVTIWGQSAGGGSVVAQVLANGGQTTPQLFTKAIVSSPYWPRFYDYNSTEAEEIYDTLTSLTGCANATDTLVCLKDLPQQTIMDASRIIAASHTYTTSSYTWAPVRDYDFLKTGLAEATLRGEVNADFVMGVFNRFEGSTFVSSGLNTAAVDSTTEEGFRNWLQGFLPKLTDEELDEIEVQYPTVGGTDEYTTVQDRAGFIYRDLVLACPAYWLATSAKKIGYMGEYTISPAKHASDVGYWNTVNSLQTTQPFLYEGYAGSFASFIQTGSPNTNKLTNDSVVSWPEVSTGEKWVMTADGFEVDTLAVLATRCDFWRGLGESIPV